MLRREALMADNSIVTRFSVSEGQAVIDQSSLADQCYVWLKNKILKREFRPNEKLSVDDLSAFLGVSRTPVKDALTRLERDGLVTVSRRVGFFVRPLSYRDVKEAFDLRLLFELHAAEEGISQLQAIAEPKLVPLVTTMAECIEGEHYRSTHYDRFLDADNRLHTLIVESADNTRMAEMYHELNVYVQVAWAHYVRELRNVIQGQHEHSMIISACAAGDSDLLKRILREHISTARDLILENISAVDELL